MCTYCAHTQASAQREEELLQNTLGMLELRQREEALKEREHLLLVREEELLMRKSRILLDSPERVRSRAQELGNRDDDASVSMTREGMVEEEAVRAAAEARAGALRVAQVCFVVALCCRVLQCVDAVCRCSVL